MLISRERPEDATHYLDDVLGRLYYKVHTDTGRWLFWYDGKWNQSTNTKSQNARMRKIGEQ
ncbi:hypothetical protein Psp6_00023 [Pseudomonas phage Psp6]|nr:hypothetical protein Psp6_00023 [Pseudomonas phage Psp6]